MMQLADIQELTITNTARIAQLRTDQGQTANIAAQLAQRLDRLELRLGSNQVKPVAPVLRLVKAG